VNNHDYSQRNQAQDLLRGFIVTLACLEHFGVILNEWYRNYFDINHIYSLWNDPQIVEIYNIHEKFLGKILPVDQLFLDISVWFIPWLTHLFIALSGFNLARKSSQQVRSSLTPYLKGCIVLGSVFYLEGLMVAPNFGQGIALYPITIWFFILGIASTLYAFTGLKGVKISFLVMFFIKMGESFSIYKIPHPDQLLEMIHPWAQQSSNPLNYLIDCLWGILLGKYLFSLGNLRNKAKLFVLFLFVLSLAFIYNFYIKSLFVVNPYSVTQFDEVLSAHLFGTIFILVICALILWIVYEFRNQKTCSIFNLFKWIGVNSLGIFLIHRILFIKILAPIRLHIGSYFGLPMTNHLIELVFCYMPATLICFWILKEIRFFGKLIIRDKIL
jgi:hypothetical protein